MKEYKKNFTVINSKGEELGEGYMYFYDDEDGIGFYVDDDIYIRNTGDASYRTVSYEYRDVFSDNFDARLWDGQTVFTTTEN